MLRYLLVVLAVLLLAVLSPAMAGDRVFRQSGNEVRIIEAPCSYAAVLQRIPEPLQQMHQRAEGRFNGQQYSACWREAGTVIMILWEDHDIGIIPADRFTDPNI